MADKRAAQEWDDEAWCAHGGHVHPVPGCQFCPKDTQAPTGCEHYQWGVCGCEHEDPFCPTMVRR